MPPGPGIAVVHADHSHGKNPLSRVCSRTIHRFIVENSTDLYEYRIRAEAIQFSLVRLSLCTEVDLSNLLYTILCRLFPILDAAR